MITINLDKARDIHRGKIRAARKSRLEQLDTAFQRELEKPEPNTAPIAAEKQALRDAPADPSIDAATTPEELKAAWPDAILGDSPYTSTVQDPLNA
jgi:hypothetical protein